MKVTAVRDESPHAAAKTAEAAASKAAKASTPAACRIVSTPTHGYAETREAAMAAFAKSWRRD
jgi:hypothetical protein